MARNTGWTCQRTSNKTRCGHHNPPRTRKCGKCGKPRPAKRAPAHMAALKLDYSEYVRVNGGVEACGICGRKPPAVKLHRDHEHKGNGRPRGLLCVACNMRLGDRVTVDWMLRAIAYLRRLEEE